MACSSSRVHCNGLVFVSAYPAVSGRVSLLFLVPNGFAVRSFKYLQKIVNFLSVMPGKQRPDDRSVSIPRLGVTELPKGTASVEICVVPQETVGLEAAFGTVPEGGSSVRRAAPPNAPRQSVTASHVLYLIALALVILWILSHVH
jgi:hypothetical protein